jgi:D-alanyl-D-alanine carboxypeptidase
MIPKKCTHAGVSYSVGAVLALSVVLGAAPQVAAGAACCGDAIPPISDPDLITLLEQTFDTTVGAPGATAAVLIRGVGMWTSARGLANKTNQAPMSPDHLFRTGSTTKPFVAALILQLESEDRLNLDDFLEDHVPGYLDGKGITLRHLLGHTSGLCDHVENPRYWEIVQQRPIELADIAEIVADCPLEFTPGATFSYSNANYIFLGLVIEALTSSPWTHALRSRILDPLGLCSTANDGCEVLPGVLARGYDGDGDDVTEAVPASCLSTGDIVTTAADLACWGDALFHGRVLGAPQLEAMVTPTTENAAYGLGIEIFTTSLGVTYGTGGGWLGHKTGFYCAPDVGVSAAVCLNTFPINRRPFEDLLLRLGLAAHQYCQAHICEPPAPFVRGDANADGQLDIGDAVFVLSYLFSNGSAPPCLHAADANDDGAVDVADGVFVLQYLFAKGPAIPPPHPDCGADPSHSPLPCDRHLPCEPD